MQILEKSNRIKGIENRFNAPIKDLFYQMHWAEDMKHRDIGLLLDAPRTTTTKWFRHFQAPTQSRRRFTDKNLTSWLHKTGELKKKPRYEGPDRRIQRTKARVNVDFFKKWSPEMAYVLGFFAADGGMFINSGGSKHFIFTARFTSATRKFLYDLKKRLELNGDLTGGCIFKRPGCYHLSYSKQDSLKLFKYIYQGVRPRFYLKRKLNKFQEAIRICGDVV